MTKEPRPGKYLTRKSYRQDLYHAFDDLKNNGFEWRSNSMKKSLSGYLLSDSKRRDIVDQMQLFIEYIMDYASQIKKSINYTVDKNYKNYK